MSATDPLARAFGAWTPLAPETVPTDEDRARLVAWLDRGLTPRPFNADRLARDGCEWWNGDTYRRPSWRDFEPEPCEVVPAPDGSFGWVVRHRRLEATDGGEADV